MIPAKRGDFHGYYFDELISYPEAWQPIIGVSRHWHGLNRGLTKLISLTPMRQTSRRVISSPCLTAASRRG